jgi:murein DD-endopeptidase MepM/ murein hydrolase activator NlpD
MTSSRSLARPGVIEQIRAHEYAEDERVRLSDLDRRNENKREECCHQMQDKWNYVSPSQSDGGRTVSTFNINMSSPFPTGACTGDFGGPDSGGHHGSTEWYIKFGMDLAAPINTEVSAVVDGHVTVFHPHKRSADTGKVFGAQIFIRSQAEATGRCGVVQAGIRHPGLIRTAQP